MGFARTAAGFFAAVVLAISLGLYLHPVPTFPELYVVQRVNQYYGSSDRDCPMCGRVVIVTGSTSGLGQSIAFQMYKMGATVVIASRSESKCIATAESFEQKYDNLTATIGKSRGKAVPRALDLSDFQSVNDFAAWFTSNYDRLDCLVNNGAINYITAPAATTDTPADQSLSRSRQGFDILFATNYMGHFILTERLLPRLKSTRQARVLQISSNSQYFVSGSDLLPADNGSGPVASKVYSAVDDPIIHKQNAYGNSKLAQILHAKELQWILDKDPSTDLKILSCSPGLTDTGMIPKGIVKEISSRLFYTSDAAMYSAFVALFSQNIKGGEYVHNSPGLMLDTSFGRWVMGLDGGDGGAKSIPVLKPIVFIMQCFYQSFYYGDIVLGTPNAAVLDKVLTESLYHWSKMFSK